MLKYISIYPNEYFITPNSPYPLSIQCIDTDGNRITCPTLTWHISTNLLSISHGGLLTGISNGNAEVYASNGTVTSNIVTVHIFSNLIISVKTPTTFPMTNSPTIFVECDASIYPPRCPNVNLRWEINNPTIGTVEFHPNPDIEHGYWTTRGMQEGNYTLKAIYGNATCNTLSFTVSGLTTKFVIEKDVLSKFIFEDKIYKINYNGLNSSNKPYLTYLFRGTNKTITLTQTSPLTTPEEIGINDIDGIPEIHTSYIRIIRADINSMTFEFRSTQIPSP